MNLCVVLCKNGVQVLNFHIHGGRGKQCDQMPRFFFILWPLKAIKLAQ